MSQNPSAPPAVERWFESSLESVDLAEEAVVEFARGHGLDEDGQHGLGMAVRESMVNAVVHGNKYSSDRRVRMLLVRDARSLKIQIRDEGDGFNPTKVADPLAPENLLKQSGRGMLLIRAFVDEFSIERAEPKGTEVTLVKRLP